MHLRQLIIACPYPCRACVTALQARSWDVATVAPCMHRVPGQVSSMIKNVSVLTWKKLVGAQNVAAVGGKMSKYLGAKEAPIFAFLQLALGFNRWHVHT